MENGFIFINSKGKEIKEGTGNGQGILYCGEKYTTESGCKCTSCNGFCGPRNGCACPECEYTLSYILYATNKMKCGQCENMLTRMHLGELWSIKKQYSSFKCNICQKKYDNFSVPVMHCLHCNYDMCPKCAFSKITTNNLQNFVSTMPIQSGGVFYCGKKFTDSGECICGLCDGYCGEKNGCSCPMCFTILSYNIYLRNKMLCGKCKNGQILFKKSLVQLACENPGYTAFICNQCGKDYNDDYHSIFHCNKCDYDVCQLCAYNIIRNETIVFPKLPIPRRNSDIILNVEDLSDSLSKLKVEEKEEKKESISNIKEDEKEKDDESDEIKCVICLNNRKCYLFQPCKHICCCDECAIKLEDCPICRKKIDFDSSFRVYI